MAKNMNVSLAYGTHLPCLIKAMEKSSGMVLELGTGLFSTPFLRYQCMLTGRKLVSYENFKEWYNFLLKYYKPNENHDIHFVDNYSEANIAGTPWDVVLIDQTPDSSRTEEILRVKDRAKFIIIHDANPSNDKVTHYSKIYPLFKYRTDWTGDNNHATVLSNTTDLSDFWK